MEFPSASPRITVKQRVGLTNIEIEYSRPGAKGRQIFGGIVPYGKIWRTGGNEATKITFSTAVKLNGVDVAAGAYALMTIPEKDEWTIVLNGKTAQWGVYKYDEKEDVLRFKAKSARNGNLVETFAIDFIDVKDDSVVIQLAWGDTTAAINVQLDFVDDVVAQIKETMASDEEKKPYYMAAQFYYKHNLDNQQALEWINEALQRSDGMYPSALKAEILERAGDKQGAIAAAKHTIEIAKKWDETTLIQASENLIEKLK